MTTKQWKPVYLKLKGDRQRSISFRRFAEKLLAQSKERNEQLGNYPNPFYQYNSAEVRIRTHSLPGYDIIEIETPTTGVLKPVSSTHLFSGMTEARENPAGVAWYLRFYPAAYEVHNAGQGIDALQGASIDGEADYIDPEIPPMRWLYNDYDGVTEEMPWFDSKFVLGPVAGRFSGTLRKLVQLQLGMNLAVGFGYGVTRSHGLRIEDLSDTRKRLWLYEIGNGVYMQHLYDYSQEELERQQGWPKYATPPEIVQNGWFTFRTEWDDDREIMDRAVWESTPATARPSLGSVTFRLLDASTYNDAVAGYGALGDYGWSFNSDCSRAVFVGIGFNKENPNIAAVNYQSSLFTITIGEDEASIESAGKSLFAHHPDDQLKMPDAIGRLESYSLWRGENGLAATQPSNAYTAPQYAYYDLNDDLQLVTYEYNAGSADTDLNGNYATGQWQSVFDSCGTFTAYGGGATNKSYESCGYARTGRGLLGQKHGFNSVLITADSLDTFTGWEGTWGGLAVNSSYRVSGWIFVGVNSYSAQAVLQWAHHALSQVEGVFNDSSYNVVIVPSFERLAIYHYKHTRKITSDAARLPLVYQLYELGSPVYTWQCFCISKCGRSTCNAFPAHHHPEKEVGNFAWVASTNWPCNQNIWSHPDFNCYYQGEPVGCWTDDVLLSCPEGVNLATGPAAQDPYEADESEYTGMLLLPDASIAVFSEDDIVNKSKPFRESSAEFGYQDVVSAFDDFSGRYVFTMPEVTPEESVSNIENDEYPTSGFLKSWVAFTGNPGFNDDV